MDIMSIINQAGGIGAIAQKLGIDETTAEQGINALAPQVANGIETQGLPAVPGDAQLTQPGVDPATSSDPTLAGSGGGLGGMLGGLLGGGGSGGGMGGILGSLLGGGGVAAGNEVLGHIFGSKDGSREVAADASQKTGIDSSVLKKLLPIVAGMVAMHYVTHRNQGAAAGQPADAGGGGILGSILGGLGR